MRKGVALEMARPVRFYGWGVNGRMQYAPTQRLLTIILSALLCASVALCENENAPPAEYAPVNAKVSLSDGSQLQGVPRLTALTLITAFGKQEIPVAHISAIEFTKEGVQVRFANRDVLSGKLEGTALVLKTIFSDVRLDYSQIKAIQFSKQGGGKLGMNEKGLLLHAVLDSANEDLGVFDARLEARNVRIIEGPDGNAMLLDTPQAQIIIDLPFSPYLLPEGTVEFWAKLPQPHKRFSPGGGQPWFFNFECPEINYICSFAFGFNGNDGLGGGGLNGRIHGYPPVATHRHGVVSNVAETGLLGDTPDGWHHYTYAWKQDGFDFPEAKGKMLLIAIDGKVVASAAPRPGVDSFDRRTEGKKIRLVVHDGNSDCSHPVAMSNLKIWDHARRPEQQ